MKKFEFTIIAAGLDPRSGELEDQFFEAGCDDATISFQKGVIILDFCREAKNLTQAISSAVEGTVAAGAKVLHIEPDCLVSLSEIAARTGLTRAAISNYANGDRGRDFPVPVARVTSESPLWDWVDVARWLCRQGRLDRSVPLKARIVRKCNSWINKDRTFRAEKRVTA